MWQDKKLIKGVLLIIKKKEKNYNKNQICIDVTFYER